ncbi:BspA family leucine-rich repeat surface protein [Flavobacteriaceae bacterium]|nr:BspA family leucine-rich repeat surface protein [Flavobacteriaceae bacterium]
MRRLTVLVFFILLACSKDSPIPDAVVPTPEPTATTFTLVVTASEGGSVTDGGTHNENTNVSLTATPAQGFTFTEWTGDATGSTNPLSVSMTQNKNITANFIRTKYILNIGKEGEGDVTKDIISTAKTSDEYNSGTLVRLTAIPSENWLFYAWNDGSTGFIDAATGLAEAEELNYTNPRDINIDRSLNVTATFERIIEEEDFPTGAVGKWKIKRPKSANKTDEAEANKSAMAECGLTEIIFRTDGSFAIVTSTTTFTGQYSFDGNTTIILTQVQAPFGTITNLIISNGSILFSISLVDGCSDNAEGNKDETYDEATDTSYPPVISLVGSSTIYLEVGETFTDPGATASDNVDGDLTSSITSSGTVDTATEGTYTIVYSVSDTDGNIASVSRTVIVSLDLPPTITLTGSSTITLLVGDTYIEDGCVATDNEDGDITSSITTSGTVDTSIAGTYTVVYSVTDSSDNSASVLREVVVNTPPDTTAPSITLTGSSTINLTVGETFTDPGATARDDVDGNLTSSITTSGAISTSNTGTFTISYSVSDAAGNSASVQRTVIVSVATTTADTTPPTITLIGSSTINLNVGNNWQDTGGTANDNVDGDLTFSMSASYPVDSTFSSVSEYNTLTFTATGTYIITYSVSDAAGNTTTVDRIIIVSAISNTTACTISGQNIGGGQSQTVTLTNAISDITFTVNSSCQENLQEEVLGLPTGVTMNFSDNTAIISGTPTGQTGDYSYVVNWYSSTSSFTLGGTITVVASSTTSTSTNSSISFVNGTCECPNASVGDTETINNVTYIVVDNSTIAGEIANGNVNLCTSLVTDMSELFKDNTSFNSDIGFWDTSNVTGLTDMFNGANSFNQDVSGWDLSSALNLSYMFFNASSFNQNISSWDISTVIYIDNLFNGATAFNQDIGGWDTSNVMGMAGVFTNGNFNRDISDWDTSSVTNMESMLSYNSSFNQDISSWNTSSVTATDDMFRNNPSFNQNISGWNVSSITSMERMFDGASAFNQDLTSWCVAGITSEPTDFAANSALTDTNKPLWGKEFTVALTSGSNSQTVTGTTAITDIVYTATPICTGSISVSASGLPSGVTLAFGNNVATISGSSNATGTFNYTATISGASTSQAVTGTITVNAAATADTTPPTITLTGSSTINLTVGDTFTDPGATATDDVDGDLTSSISITDPGAFTSTAGTYTISYSVSDAAGNAATVVQRTIIVSVAVASIYFENGTCKCPNATVGDTADINGVTYTAVDNSTIAAQIANGNGNLCTTLVNDMNYLLFNTSFNEDISFWDTSNVTNMEAMFRGASFNRNISNWDTSSVTNMKNLFWLNITFNQNISSWNTSNVTNMNFIFTEATAFNQDIGNWDVSNVTNAVAMFSGATAFNQDLSGWDISNWTSLNGLFGGATSFNQDISSWVTSNITSMRDMFSGATAFNQDLSGWNTSSVNNMKGMFKDASSFNQDIGGWNTSNVTDMAFMFDGGSIFNQDIGNWNTSNVTTMGFMFRNATDFNQDLKGWCVSGITSEPSDFATTSELTEANKPLWGTCPNYNINVTASSNSDYTLSGTDRNGAVSGNDPSITINVGDEINFIVDAASHPFYIKTVQGTGTDNQVSNVTNNGATSGVVNWTPTTAGTYYYQCSVHDGMYGTITVQ